MDKSRSFFENYDHILTGVVVWSKWRFDPHQQEDVAQRIREKLMKSDLIETPPPHVESCVARVAINTCIDEIRRLSRHSQTFSYVAYDSLVLKNASGAKGKSDLVARIAADEHRRMLKELVSGLGEPCASTIARFYLKGQSYENIAADDGIATNTVGSRLNRCLEKLRHRLAANPTFQKELSDFLED